MKKNYLLILMIYYLLAIVIILLLSVVAVFYFENNETFQELNLGDFNPNLYTNYISCMKGIINGDCSGGTNTDCLTACKNTFQNSGECAPLPLDIRGNDILKCVESCGENGGERCHLDANGNPINLIEQAQSYLDKYRNENILTRKTTSGESYDDFRNQSKCLQECLKCGWNVGNVNDNCKCKWSPECMNEEEMSFENYRDNIWNSGDHKFMINAIPENGKISVAWEESKRGSIDGYIIYIFTKNNIGQVETRRIRMDDPKLIEREQGKFVYEVDNLTNNELYGVQLNKLSKKFPNNQKLVKPSNTIYAKPSEVSILDFTGAQDSRNEQCSFLSENLLNNFKGKTFDINFG